MSFNCVVMRLLVCSFIFYFFANVAYAQKEPFTSQSFVINEVVVKSFPDQFNPYVKISFKLVSKYSLNDIETEGGSMFQRYKLAFYLCGVDDADTLTDIIYQSSYTMMSSVKGLYQNSYQVSFDIPFFQFRKVGLLDFRICGLVSTERNSTQLPVKPSSPTKVLIKKTYPIQQQIITVKNVKIANAADPKEGKIVEFNYKFKYNENELYSDESNKSFSNNIYFYAECFDRNNLCVSPKIRNLANYEMIKFRKGVEFKGLLFIPYTELNLNEGSQNIRYALNASTIGEYKSWKSLYVGEVQMTLPPKYLTKITFRNIAMYETKYDVAGKDIPLVNIFISLRKSSGQGFPDIYWKLSRKGRNIGRSLTYRNSFYFYDDSILTQTVAGDKLLFSVMDQDFFSSDDVIGQLSLKLDYKEKQYFEKLQFGGVRSGSIAVQKKPFIQYNLHDVAVEKGLYNGLSGYFLKALYSKRFDLKLSLSIIQKPDTLRFDNLISIDNGPDRFSYFIPASVIKNPSSLLLELIDRDLNMVIERESISLSFD